MPSNRTPYDLIPTRSWQVWPSAVPTPVSASLPAVALVAEQLQKLLRAGATPEEAIAIPSLQSDTPVLRFIDEWQSWRAVLAREPFASALRSMEGR